MTQKITSSESTSAASVACPAPLVVNQLADIGHMARRQEKTKVYALMMLPP